jgi:CHAT domain-containing protein
MSARLSAKLAVLCACETEKGRYVEGEGEIGCGWAFLYAGCASTLVSQWRVDRDATFQLTKEFCQALDRGLMASSGQVSLAGLLRSTQLAMLADGHYGHPFYWAGIVLVGDPLWRSRPIILEQ